MMHEAPATPRRRSSSDEDAFADANKYDDLEEAERLLESGEKPKIKAPPRNLFGFYLQYFAVGVVYGGLPSTIYGFFLGYLNVEGYVYATCATIVGLPWSFKFIFGAINDCFPILGYRRKPYMVIGWWDSCGPEACSRSSASPRRSGSATRVVTSNVHYGRAKNNASERTKGGGRAAPARRRRPRRAATIRGRGRGAGARRRAPRSACRCPRCPALKRR